MSIFHTSHGDRNGPTPDPTPKEKMVENNKWRPYSRYLKTHSQHYFARQRESYGIQVEGDQIPPVMTRFSQMRLPGSVLDYLKHMKDIHKPTPIQMQGIPTVLSGRDMIGVAYTGSGKSLTFILPFVLFAIEAEESLDFVDEEGPLALILVPSRELAKQIHGQIEDLAEHMYRRRYAKIRSMLIIGGTNVSEQASELRRHGTHIVVATPGRLLDLLEKKNIYLDTCRYLCMDEADRMVGLGFDVEVQRILKQLTGPRQTILFSATMPVSIKEFAENVLSNPVVVTVGRAGSTSKSIEQCVEWVPNESGPTALLEALQKTAPPVIVFSQNKFDVNDVQEFLLRKGVQAVAVHGSKTQEERTYALESFKKGKSDVLVATDIASKGLDIPNIQHVINYDMPTEIEDYIHRIGRTGRGGKPGLSTTFVNSTCSQSILADLKHLLVEADQAIPPFLKDIETGVVDGGCSVCGGMGHAESNCPKLHLQTSKVISQQLRSDPDLYQ